jgi:hypothetical protein
MSDFHAGALRYCPSHSEVVSTVGRFARLRGLVEGFRDLTREDGARTLAEGARLIAISGRALEAMPPGQARRLKNLVQAGAVVYIRGFAPGRAYSLAPFAEGSFAPTAIGPVTEYRFTADPLVPPALADEAIDGSFALPAAESVDAARALLVAITPQGSQRAVIFAINAGAGIAIYDPQNDNDPAAIAETSLVERLAEPHARLADAGALMAANWAAGYRRRSPVAYDLVLDDRPRSFDWMHNRATFAWLAHMREVCADLHVDFAWTPAQAYPSRGYIGILRRFNTGFVWHGFHRHVDHGLITHPERALARGKRLVDAICKRYGVVFQRIMVLPFERANPEVIRTLKHAGFIASIESAYSQWGGETHLPPYLRHATPLQTLYTGFFPVLRRYPMNWLNDDRLLALGALDLPIIATAHPHDFALRNFSRLRDDGTKEGFDRVLMFAARKRLRPRSLEEIASEMADPS